MQIPQSIPTDVYEIYDFYAPPFYQQPLWLAVITASLLAVGIGLFFLIRYWQNRALPPHEWALTELKKLQQKSVLNKEEFKFFYFVLTKILKEYLVKRYELNIMAKTDEELTNYLADKKFNPILLEELKKIHGNALLVKFANQEIIKTQAEKDLAAAFAFIEQTKPNQHKKT